MNQMDMGNQEEMRNQMENAGRRIDFEVETTMAMELPQGKYSENMLNKLVDALNKFAPMMEFTAIDKVSGEQTQMPLELVQLIMGIAGAAEEADMALQINLSEMESDRDIASLVGQLESLLKNAEFKKFLEEDVFGDEEPVEREMEDEVAVERDAEEDLDEMFARRV
tara:strand:+ start:1110 stop:1610 length:501 start_codon:yes stop_codon:yes gene_type:complete